MEPLLFSPQSFSEIFGTLLLWVLSIIFLLVLSGGGIYMLLLWSKSRGRESESLASTLLQVSLPRDNPKERRNT
ncbi:MAG: hypothetical protein HYT11_03250 [Candidatus Levybacteria bacterium]|nr:hypothetical protein [Candidatus Levybacteria bacterium]